MLEGRELNIGYIEKNQHRIDGNLLYIPVEFQTEQNRQLNKRKTD